MSKVKIAFDGQIFSRQRVGGISRGHAQLLAHFDRSPQLGVSVDLEFGWHRNGHLRTRNDEVRRVSQGSVLDHRRVVDLLNLRYAPQIVRRTSVPLQGTFYSPLVEAACGRRPVVITLYDMIPEIVEFAAARTSHLNKLRLIDKADLVIAISQTAADQLARTGAPHTRVTVCRWGVDVLLEKVLEGPDHSEFRLLYVGPRGGHKNFTVLLQALSTAKFVSPVVLTAAGGGHWTATERQMISSVNRRVEIRQVNASDAMLNEYYRTSDLFISTSLVEGFGLPPLEAMSAGLPVLCSDIEAHREVAGPAARMFDPRSSTQLATAIEELSRDVDERLKMSNEGKMRARCFDWRTSAESHACAYATL